MMITEELIATRRRIHHEAGELAKEIREAIVGRAIDGAIPEREIAFFDELLQNLDELLQNLDALSERAP